LELADHRISDPWIAKGKVTSLIGQTPNLDNWDHLP